MQFKIESKDQDGNIIFSGSASQQEATFLLNIGVNYLLANGAMPLLLGKDDGELSAVVPSSDTVQ